MKYKLRTYSCIKCGNKETDHKNPDARRCPMCESPTISYYSSKENK